MRNSKLPQPPLLVTREQAAELLGGISITSLKRLERTGVLRPKRLTRKATGQVFYSYDNVQRAAREAFDADA